MLDIERELIGHTYSTHDRVYSTEMRSGVEYLNIQLPWMYDSVQQGDESKPADYAQYLAGRYYELVGKKLVKDGNDKES